MCKQRLYLFLIVLIFGLVQCAPSRFVKPLEKDEWSVGVNAGGPVINLFDMRFPVPFSSIYGGYGYTDRLTLHGGLHTTSLLYKTLQLDAGATYLVSENGPLLPGLSLSGSVNTLLDFRAYNLRAYPSLAGNLFYDYKYGRFYGGIEQWIDLFPEAVPDGSQYNPWVPALFVGQTIKIKKFEITLEYKNLAPLSWNKGHVVRYARNGDRGANGFYISFQKAFGG